MFFALCRVEIFIPQGRSLKGKRSVVGSIKERLRARFHASVAEIDHQDLHQRGVLGIGLVGRRPGPLEAALEAMRRMIDAESRCTVTSWEVRVEPFDGAPRAQRDTVLAPPVERSWDEIEADDECYGPSWDESEQE